MGVDFNIEPNVLCAMGLSLSQFRILHQTKTVWISSSLLEACLWWKVLLREGIYTELYTRDREFSVRIAARYGERRKWIIYGGTTI